MSKLIIPLLFIACMIMTACGNDDEPKMELSGEYLEATTWDAEMTDTNYPSSSHQDHFVMQFLTKDSGKCIATYGDSDYSGNFTYHITKEMITFNGSLVGNWTVKEHTKTTIVLQSFQPKEVVLALTKI